MQVLLSKPSLENNIMELSYSICKCVLKYPNGNEGVDKVKVFSEHMKEDHKTLTNCAICFVTSVLQDDDIAIARELLATYNNENTQADMWGRHRDG